MLLTSSARCGGSFFWKSPSNRRLPTCPGTGASSQLDRPEENSQANKCCLPPLRRYRTYHNRSIARVPTAPAASPRPTAPSGVPAVFRLMPLQDLIGTVRDWFTAVLLITGPRAASSSVDIVISRAPRFAGTLRRRVWLH